MTRPMPHSLMLGAALTLFATSVGAAEPPTEARAANERAQVCYKLQDWRCSIAEWKRAYELFRNPVILFNLAQAQRQAGDLKSALMSYKFYSNDSPTGSFKTVADEMIAKLQPLVDKAEATKTEPPVGVGKSEVDKTSQTAHPALTTPASPPAESKRSKSRTGLYAAVGIIAGVVVGGAAVGIGVGVSTAASSPTTSIPSSGDYGALHF